MERMPSPGVFPRVGSGRNTVNLVPVDYVVEAMARLAAAPEAQGRTYHLTDPAPLSALEIARALSRALGKSFLYMPVPGALLKAAFRPSSVQSFFGMPVQTLDYFDHPCSYDASQASAALQPLGVVCPRFVDYADVLVRFYREKKASVRRSAMT
jgi:nucleoside-diphosphate-sugar epimerase